MPAIRRPSLSRWIAPTAASLILFGSFLPAAEPPSTSAEIDYNRQIRPILSNNCYKCHGPDADEREGELRLDVRAAALEPADSGDRAIVPGKPDDSALVKRIFSAKRSLVMPPPSSNKTLTPAEKQLLKDWVAQGAKYQTHWAFQAPQRPALPTVKRPGWVRNPIDNFILARLESEGLAPSPEAEKTTLVRRLAFDLTGLPPTLAEIDAFLADSKPDAYERLVDHFLASNRYGERMALDWLDAARYADTHGYHIDSGRDMTRWRDWVIGAFNKNLPFNQFTIEQIAGDLLPKPTLDQKIASGFNRNHMITFEGGAIPDEYHTAYIIDRVNTTGTVWLGLTVGCTQCHDHKYDPITQKDFYSLYAFFNNVPENGLDGSKGNAAPMIPAPSASQHEAIEQLKASIARTEARVDALSPEADAQQVAWEKTVKTSDLDTWTPLALTTLKAQNGTRLRKESDGSIIASGPNPGTETFTISAKTITEGATALRLELLPDPKLKGGGPGRSINGNVVLTDVRVLAKTCCDETARDLTLKSAVADFSQTGFPAVNAIDADPKTGWAIDPEEGKRHALTVLLAEPIGCGGDVDWTVTLSFNSAFAGHHPGKFALAVTSSPTPLPSESRPADVIAALKTEPEKRTEEQRKILRTYFLSQVFAATRPIMTELEALRRELASAEGRVSTVMVMEEMDKPRDTFMLVRGQYDKHGDKVTPAVPSFLPPLPDGVKPDRLALARWLVDPGHPLVGRVTVNRLWQTFFGTGIVLTSEDFGSQGQGPSHPELLDWLAVEFVSPKAPGSTPWDIKSLVRTIVTSAAYRQRSVSTPDLIARDPENRLLARGPRVRLQAEFLRDQALAVSGLLNDEIGGKSVSPYQPTGLWEELMSRADGANWSAQTYVQSHGKDLYRRTMYTFWKRTSPPPSLATFDAPDRETCTVRRSRTNTPLQALVLLNDPTYVEASRKLAERLLIEAGPTSSDRITLAFRLCAARSPGRNEIDVLTRLLDAELSNYRQNPAGALKLINVGEAPRNTKVDGAELAAWTTVASVVLNLDEVLNKN